MCGDLDPNQRTGTWNVSRSIPRVRTNVRENANVLNGVTKKSFRKSRKTVKKIIRKVLLNITTLEKKLSHQ